MNLIRGMPTMSTHVCSSLPLFVPCFAIAIYLCVCSRLFVYLVTEIIQNEQKLPVQKFSALKTFLVAMKSQVGVLKPRFKNVYGPISPRKNYARLNTHTLHKLPRVMCSHLVVLCIAKGECCSCKFLCLAQL